ncbi:MAG: nucleotidyltransferase family protein [Anaerolineae bacterium]
MAEQAQSRQDESVGQFLRLCLRGRWDPAALEVARALRARSDFDWDALRWVAYIEGVAPLLYDIARGQDLLPPSVKQDLRLVCYYHAGRNLLLLHKLEDVVGHLAAESVPVILLKGAALAKTVYGNDAVRPMADLDLLVQREHVSTALRVLSALGYEPAHAEFRAGYVVTYRNEVMLVKPGEVNVPIEIHWSLFSPLYYQHAVPMDWFWQTALPASVGDVPTWILGPEAQVLHLCSHMLLHHGHEGEPRLLWLHDVAEVIAFYQEQIDWDQLLAQAQAYDLVLPVQWILTRVGDEWHAPIPTDVLERLRALCPSRGEKRLFNWLTTARRPVQRLWAHLASTPGWGPRLRSAWCVLFPSAGYMQDRYRIPHPLLVPLYYPYRWLRGLRSIPRWRDRVLTRLSPRKAA